jgi:hypothetical protein
MAATAILFQNINKAKQYLRLSESFLRRHNPIQALCDAVVNGIKDALTANKKLKIAKYRVNHLRYRLHQMEQLIDGGNPYNNKDGKNINFLR